MSVFITDFITKPDIEKKILGNFLSKRLTKEITVLLVWHQKCDKAYLNKFPNLKAIIRYGVGIDNIDLSYAKKKNIKVANTPDYGIDEVSDTAIAFLMMHSRKISEYNRNLLFIRDYKNLWQERKIHNIKRSNKINVCSIGAGRIGSKFLSKAKAIGFNTYFYDPYLKSGYDKVLNAIRINDLSEIAKKSDVISLHCPLSAETKNIIDKKILSTLKKNTLIINTARGGLVNEHEIAEYIQIGKINYATDVLEQEPPSDENPLIKLWRSKQYNENIIINPHTAFYSKNAFIEMRYKCALNAYNFIRKNKLINII